MFIWKSENIIKMILLIVLVIVLCALCVRCFTPKEIKYKSDIYALVKDNGDVLLADIEQNDFTRTNQFEQVKKVYAMTDSGCVQYDCGGYGLSVSSHEFGFYYSEQDIPMAVFDGSFLGLDAGFKKEGNGYSSTFDHNVYYTEKICDNFWYFEVHF